MSQGFGLMVEVPLFMMTIGAIAVPTSFHETFGEQECIAYNLMFPTINIWGTICGFTMAVYRWTCMKGKRYEINYFIGIALGLVTLFLMNAPFEPKTSPGYQFCMGIQPRTSPNITPISIESKILTCGSSTGIIRICDLPLHFEGAAKAQ